jgi:tRNA uridine 5-carboxymethylaminomethyl modification enzyme
LHQRVVALEKEITDMREWLQNTRSNGSSIWDHIRCARMTWDEIDEMKTVGAEARRQLEIENHYEGYIKQEAKRVASMQRLDRWRIPKNFIYDMPGLRNESRTKLEKVKPETLAQAARIDGVTPAEISLLQVHLKRKKST